MAERSPLEPMVKTLESRRPLSGDDRAALRALPNVVRTLQHHHYIVREHDRVEFTCVLLSGYAARHKIVAGGQRQIVGIHMNGDLIDLHNSLLGFADHNVQMLTAGKVASVPRAEIVRIATERPAIGQAMWLDTLVDASISREWIANVGRRDARARIAHVLCEFALRLKSAGLGEHTNYELPMTQEQLADTTGLTPVHVNRTLKSLEAAGLIARSNPRFVTIGDWHKLTEAGDFTSSYLHLQPEEPALAQQA